MMPTVLLTNDDGPPHAKTSPYIYRFSQILRDSGWDVKVVIPSSQKSWIGKAFHITETTQGRYYYPQNPDGFGDTSEISRPLKEGETAEWILLDGTPATCANVALHNIFPGQIDLVISGPNVGRNTSTAFALSSGTIGAALSSSLAGYRSIALSYGTVVHPTPQTYFEPAHRVACSIIRHLYGTNGENWGADKGGLRNEEIDFYNINIPLIQGILSQEALPICNTFLWRNNYGQLFKSVQAKSTSSQEDTIRTPGAAGPDALSSESNGKSKPAAETSPVIGGPLAFAFAPSMQALITPAPESIPVGSDGWAMHKGWISVTPLRAAFAEPEGIAEGELEGRMWNVKMKL